MAEINPNWARWIVTSLAVYFKAIADDVGIEFLVAGVDERESETVETDHAELRVNGPFIRQLSSGYFRLDVDSNILLSDFIGGSENPYKLIDWAGKFQQAAERSIPVYRYGPDTSVDDGSLLGCLSVRGGKNGSDIYQFGQVNANDRIRQVSVDTRHWMFLTVLE